MIFIRLQAANDAGDLNDLRAFTTPEMFAAVKLDLQERGPTAQRTDVVRVDAEVLDVASEADRQVVSVRFHGLIREQIDGVAEPFDEVWHLVKPTDGSREWAIAGIQQAETRRDRLKLFVVTGASRGMGAALAEQLLADAGHTVLGIARRANDALAAVAAQSGATLRAMAGRPGRADRRRRPPAGLARRARRRTSSPRPR